MIGGIEGIMSIVTNLGLDTLDFLIRVSEPGQKS